MRALSETEPAAPDRRSWRLKFAPVVVIAAGALIAAGCTSGDESADAPTDPIERIDGEAPPITAGDGLVPGLVSVEAVDGDVPDEIPAVVADEQGDSGGEGAGTGGDPQDPSTSDGDGDTGSTPAAPPETLAPVTSIPPQPVEEWAPLEDDNAALGLEQPIDPAIHDDSAGLACANAELAWIAASSGDSDTASNLVAQVTSWSETSSNGAVIDAVAALNVADSIDAEALESVLNACEELGYER